MNSRQRVIGAIEKEEIDRTPLDGWFQPRVWDKLRSHYGVGSNEAVKKKLGIDIREVFMYPSANFRPPPKTNEASYDYIELAFYEEWGIEREVSSSGVFRVKTNPLQRLSLDEYTMPDVDAPGRFDAAEKRVTELQGEHAVAGRAVFGLFDLSCYLRGFKEFIRDLYTNPHFVNKLLDRLVEWKIAQGRRFLEMGVDIIELSDDLGFQTGMFLPPDLWRRWFKPRLLKWFREIKRIRPDVYIFFHSDGYIEPVIPDLIEAGVDILNPIQPECMDPAEIKRKYGANLTLHGTISLQKTLPFGTIEDVRNEVAARIRTVGYDDGLILAPTNHVSTDVPLTNLIAMYDAVRRQG